MQADVIKSDESKEYYFKEGCHILELSNDPDDPEVSIARAKVNPGQSTYWHVLKDTCERYVILQGQGIVYVGEHLEQTVAVGDVVRIPAGVRQKIKNTGDGDLIFLAICSPRFLVANYQQD